MIWPPALSWQTIRFHKKVPSPWATWLASKIYGQLRKPPLLDRMHVKTILHASCLPRSLWQRRCARLHKASRSTALAASLAAVTVLARQKARFGF